MLERRLTHFTDNLLPFWHLPSHHAKKRGCGDLPSSFFLASFEGPIEDIDSGTGGLGVFHSERSNKASALFMAISDRMTESWQAPSFSPPRGSARNRIIPAAAHVLQTEPDNFSVQRVARRAGISARAIYGHFSSGAELASAARMLMLQEMIERLPAQVNP